MSDLPYIYSKADPDLCRKRITNSLTKFGVSRIIFDDDLDKNILTLKFIYENMPITIPIDYGKLGGKFKENKTSWDSERAKHQAYKASFSIMDDYVKSLLSIVSSSVFTFEQIFLPHFTVDGVETLADIMVPKIREISNGEYKIPESLGEITAGNATWLE